MEFAVREYTAADERAWLHCRVLSFLDTAYFDNVLRARPPLAAPGFGLVAAGESGLVAGIVDVAVLDGLATIDTVAVHPDHRHRGIGRALLAAALTRLGALKVGTLDAWTRDDPDTLRWYRAVGFTESEHYLHVYADHATDPGEPDRAVGARRPGLSPVTAFLHGSLAEEASLREQFARVHVCRRFSMEL